MIEEKGFCKRLRHVDEVVVSLDVSQFVCEDRFHLSRRQVGQRRDWEQNDRPQPTNGHRRCDACGFNDARESPETELGGDPISRWLPAGCH